MCSVRILQYFLLVIFFKSAFGDLKLTATNVKTKIPLPLSRHSLVYDGLDSIYLWCGLFLGSNLEILRFNITSETLELIAQTPNNGWKGSLQFDSSSSNLFYFGGDISSQNVYKFSPQTQKLDFVTKLPFPLRHGTTAKFNESSVLILGGEEKDCKNLWSFHLNKKEFQSLYNFSESFCDSSIIVDGNKMFLFGRKKSLFEFDISTGNYKFVEFPHFKYSTAVSDLNGFAYIIGKQKQTNQERGVWQFDMDSLKMAFIKIDNFPYNYGNASLEVAPASVYVNRTGRIYFFGGMSKSDGRIEYHNDIWYVDVTSLKKRFRTTSRRKPCENKSDGIYPHPYDTDKRLFIGCRRGQMEIFTCPKPLIFDQSVRNCNLPQLMHKK